MEDRQKRGLPLIETFRGMRRGYTTGACAAAACKAAAIAFFTGKRVKEVQITLPIGQTVFLPVHRCKIQKDGVIASIIKDAGDDPDVTNGVEIKAEVSGQGSGVRGIKAFQFSIFSLQFTIYGGEGVGVVTKPGLAVPPGEPAINPIPRRMIEDSLREVFSRPTHHASRITVVISVPNGEEIAKKTMNARLGIIGGISILGTTGVVEPLSLSSYRHSIICAMNVAIASGCKELVFSTGRSSEKVAERELGLPQEAFILVGDHMGFALKEAGQRPKVKGITVVGQFGKFSKLAQGQFETHSSDSNIELKFLAGLAKEAGGGRGIIEDIKMANTARQVFLILKEEGLKKVLKMICEKVKENSVRIAGVDNINCILVGYDNEVVEGV